MRRYERWRTRQERDAVKQEIASAGSVRDWIRGALKKKPPSDEERRRHEAANAVADRFGFPRPYPDLDAQSRADAPP